MQKIARSHWTTDPRQALRPGPGFDLTTYDRAGTPAWKGDRPGAETLMAARGELLNELQERLFAESRIGGKRNVLIIVQGLDTAGKGGIARHVMGYLDPQGVQIKSFGVPTEEERAHHYLWRIRNALPLPGRIGVFDRSHYEDVLVVRVDELVEPSVWEPRYEEINAFEKELTDAGTVVLKFALMVSYEEQGLRLMDRLDRPDKHWKYSLSDLRTRAKWDKYQEAYQAVLDRTNTDHAPWHVVPADHKWFPRLAVTEVLTRTMADMDLGWPQVSWNDDEQRAAVAATLSTKSLVKSLIGTRANVSAAIEESIEVRADSAELIDSNPDLSRRRIEAKRATLMAEMEQNIAHKRQLLTDRDDAPTPLPQG